MHEIRRKKMELSEEKFLCRKSSSFFVFHIYWNTTKNQKKSLVVFNKKKN